MIDLRSLFSRACPMAFAGALAVAALGPQAHAQTSPQFTMKMGTLAQNDETQQWLTIFSKAVEERSGGRIKGEIFPGGQLGSAAREIEGTQFGSIQIIIMPPDFLAGVDERFEVGSAPGTFSSVDQVNRVTFDPEFRQAFLALGANKGLIGLALFMNAPVTTLTRQPIHRLADYKGLKIRILASDFQVEQIKRLDATPVAMSLGDVLTALQQGTIDGALASVPAFTPLHFYDAAKYMTETSEYYVLIVAEMSQKWFNTLPPDLQKIVMEEGMNASRQIIQWTAEDMVNERKAWTDHGGVLESLPPADQAEMMKRMSTIAVDVGEKRPAIKEMYATLQAAVKRNP